MLENRWDQFVIYVNAYYAVQEAYDSARRGGQTIADGLSEFCRDANPFLWDTKSSAEEALYEGFCTEFDERFENGMCTSQEGYEFARYWLRTQEGSVYGTSLVSSFDLICDLFSFAEACEPIERQIASRASRLERTPQDIPDLPAESVPATPSEADVEAVIAMLAKGDEAFAQSLRDRLQSSE